MAPISKKEFATLSEGTKRVPLGGGLYQRRDGRFEHRYTDGATKKRHTVTLESTTRTAARLEIAGKLNKIANETQIAPSRITLNELSVEYFDELRSLVASGDAAQRTYDIRWQQFHSHIAGRLGHLPVQKIKPADCGRVVRELRTSGKSSWTQHGVLITLGAILKFAADDERGIISASPTKRISDASRPKAENKREVYVPSAEELQTLIASTSESWKTFVLLLAFTGLRASEALGLRWQDIDTTAGVLHVRSQLGRNGELCVLKTKAAKRDIGLAPELKKALAQGKLANAPTAFAFATESGRPRSYRNAVRAFTASLKRAKLDTGEERLSLHCFRHFFASALIANGWDVVRVSKRLGHSKPSTTLDIYAAEFEKAQRKGELDEGTLISGAISGVAVG